MSQGNACECNAGQSPEAPGCLTLGEQAPNNGIDRSAKQLRCLVPSALRASVPGHAERWASKGEASDVPIIRQALPARNVR